MKDYTVRIVYKNNNLDVVNEHVYDFEEYVNIAKLELTRMIMEVEDALTKASGKEREEWDETTRKNFQHIRHKLLDQANAIVRLPHELYYKNEKCDLVKASDMFAEMINNRNK